MRSPTLTTIARPGALSIAILLAGCASSGSGGRGGGGGGAGDREADQVRYVERGLVQAERSVSPGDTDTERAPSDTPPVMLDGTPIGWDTLRPLLAEAAGRTIVEEAVLTRLVQAECRRRDITITRADVQAEQTFLIDALTDAQPVAASNPDNIQQLVARVRAQRGLGPERWRELLERNAMLRALVRDAVLVTDEALERTHALLYGPDYPTRLIVTATARQAADAVRRIKEGQSFGEVAADVSIDPSADRGGIIDPINTADPTWPQAIRRAVEDLASAGVIGRAGEVSDPILLDEGFAIIWLERAPDPKGVPSVGAVRAELERLVRVEQERLLMQREARRLLDEARVDVLDQSLEWSRTSAR